MPTAAALCRPVPVASMNPSVADYALIKIVRVGAAYGDRNRSTTGRTGRTVRCYQPGLRAIGRLAPPVMAKRARRICMFINWHPQGYRPLLPLLGLARPAPRSGATQDLGSAVGPDTWPGKTFCEVQPSPEEGCGQGLGREVPGSCPAGPGHVSGLVVAARMLVIDRLKLLGLAFLGPVGGLAGARNGGHEASL